MLETVPHAKAGHHTHSSLLDLFFWNLASSSYPTDSMCGVYVCVHVREYMCVCVCDFVL